MTLPAAALTDFIAPVAGLLGVLVGGYIAASATGGLEERRWREQGRVERLRESAEILGMVRVHLDELDRIAGAVRTVQRTGALGSRTPESLVTLFPRLPREERRMMSRHFTRSTWGDLTSAHFSADLFLDAAARYDGSQPLDADGRDFLQTTLDAIEKGQQALVMLETGAQSEWLAATERTGEWEQPSTLRDRARAIGSRLSRSLRETD